MNESASAQPPVNPYSPPQSQGDINSLAQSEVSDKELKKLINLGKSVSQIVLAILLSLIIPLIFPIITVLTIVWHIQIRKTLNDPRFTSAFETIKKLSKKDQKSMMLRGGLNGALATIYVNRNNVYAPWIALGVLAIAIGVLILINM